MSSSSRLSTLTIGGTSTFTPSTTNASGSVVPLSTMSSSSRLSTLTIGGTSISSSSGLSSLWVSGTSIFTVTTTDANGSVVPLFTTSVVPVLTTSLVTIPFPTTTPTVSSTTTSASTTKMPSAIMMQGLTSCYNNWDTFYATANSALGIVGKELKKFEKKETERFEQQRNQCVYDRCMEGVTKSCLVTSTTATTTVMWNAIKEPAQTSIIASQLAFIRAVPRTRAHYDIDPWEARNASTFVPMPWEDNRILLNKTERKASDKFVGSLNWTELLAAEYLYPAQVLNCSFQADSYIVGDDSKRLNRYLGKGKTLGGCDSAASCQRRCAALVGIKDPKKWKKPVIVTFSIIGGIFLLASLLAICCCLRRRRVPRSRLPRQPTVHDPEPSMSQAPARVQTPTQSPRVVRTPASAPAPAPAPTPAPAPAPNSSTAVPSPAPPQKTIVRRVEDAPGQPPVVEQIESAPGAPGAPGAVDEVVKPVPSTTHVQVVPRAPTGAF